MAHKYPMINMNEAVDKVISRAHPLPHENVALVDAVGRVVAENFVAPRPHPPFAASVMDGYAVRGEDCPGVLALIGASRAGAPMRGAGDTSVNPDSARTSPPAHRFPPARMPWSHPRIAEWTGASSRSTPRWRPASGFDPSG